MVNATGAAMAVSGRNMLGEAWMMRNGRVGVAGVGWSSWPKTAGASNSAITAVANKRVSFMRNAPGRLNFFANLGQSKLGNYWAHRIAKHCDSAHRACQ